MSIPKTADLEVVVNYLKNEGIQVTPGMKNLLNYFKDNYVVTFTHSGFGHDSVDVYKFISEKTGMHRDTVVINSRKLEECGVLGTQKGIKSIGGREYEYGFTSLVERLYE
ncbi:hypothetical protein HY837_02180 [archaeon]|nr:hypothetical protein [archaeon]